NVSALRSAAPVAANHWSKALRIRCSPSKPLPKAWCSATYAVIRGKSMDLLPGGFIAVPPAGEVPESRGAVPEPLGANHRHLGADTRGYSRRFDGRADRQSS